jgi:hypothetical protein
MFDWYQPVYYLTPTIFFPHEKKILGRWLGVAEYFTDEMAYTILGAKGVVVIRKSIWALTANEIGTDMIREQIETLDESLKHLREHDSKERTALPVLDLLSNDEDEKNSPADEEMTSLELGDATPEELDEYLNAQLLFWQNGDSRSARVTKRRRTEDWQLFGQRHENLVLDSREYEVEFQNGSLETFSTNTVVENMYAQIDPEGKSHRIFAGITDHRNTVPEGQVQPTSHKTTKCWD